MLRFRLGADQNDAIWRTATGLSGYSNITLSFSLTGASIDGDDDAIAVEVLRDGGSTWTRLQTFNTTQTGTIYNYDVTSYKANLAVKFIMVGGDLMDTSEPGHR